MERINMGTAESPLKVKLFMAVLANPEADSAAATGRLVREFGEIECGFGPVPFSYSDYYRDEMGENLVKSYMVFKDVVDRERLAMMKQFTNALEHDFSALGRRSINIDPGYIARDKLVLASTKDFFHRIYIGEGIYAETTLHFRKGIFRHFSWTYPDYMDEKFLEFLTKARAKYIHEIRQEE
jgi:hypothetical protein